MKKHFYKLHCGNFFDCSVNEEKKIKHILQIKKQLLMTKRDAKKYLNNLFNKHQIKKEFYYYLLSPTNSDIYIDVTKKINFKKTFKWSKKENKIPIILLKMWKIYEQKKSQNYQNDRAVTYNLGYYLHSDSILKKYDVFFRKNVSKFTLQLINVLSNNPAKNQRIIAAYLLGWSKEVKKVQKALERIFINDPEHEVHNAAGRSLFPIILKKKKIEIEPYLNLLCHNHTLCRNKACGILAFAPLTENQKKYTIEKSSAILKKMYNSPHPYNKRPAKLLAQRWNIQKIFKNVG